MAMGGKQKDLRGGGAIGRVERFDPERAYKFIMELQYVGIMQS